MDWNNDGKTDLIAGDTRGQVWLFLNVGEKGKPKLAEGKLVEADGKVITGRAKPPTAGHKLAKTYSKLHMADWDGDGLKDLLIGHSSTIVLYKNAGTASAPKLKAPVLVPPPKGKFPLRPSPYVVDWDGDGKQDLLIGTERNGVLFYRNIGTAKAPRLAEGKALELKTGDAVAGSRWRIDVADWNNDGKKDILIGTFSRRTGPKRKYGGNIWLFLGK